MELLSPDVTLCTDGGGRVRQALESVVGSKIVARWFAALGTATYQGIEPEQMRAELTWINGSAGVIFRAAALRGGHVYADGVTLVWVTGNSGTGKSTVCEVLRARVAWGRMSR
ncbi:hypothetical protein [Streptomyces sp. NPDC001286]